MKNYRHLNVKSVKNCLEENVIFFYIKNSAWKTKVIWICKKILAWGSRQSRAIKIETSWSVETNFFKVPRFSWQSRPTFFSRSRFLKSRLFNRDLAVSRFSSILLRFVETFQDLFRYLNIIETFWGTLGSKILTNWEISIEKYDKID
jgi:hypothetical protein